MALDRSPRRIDVRTEEDVHKAGFVARRISGGPGEVDLVVRELAWNLVRHAGGGRIEISPLHQDHRHGIHIVCGDQGPGITSMRQRTRLSGLGLGLGTISRHCNEFTLRTDAGGGTRIEAVIWWHCRSL